MMKKSIIILSILSFYISCSTNKIPVQNVETIEYYDTNHFIVSIIKYPLYEQLKDKILLNIFFENKRIDYKYNISPRCSSFMRDFGASSIVINDYDIEELLQEYSSDMEKLAFVKLDLFQFDEEHMKLKIDVFGTTERIIDRTFDDQYQLIWSGSAVGKTTNIESKIEREEIMHFLIECYFDGKSIGSEYSYEIKRNKY